MTNLRFEELLQRFISDSISPAELVELQQWVLDDTATDVLDAVLQHAYRNPELAVYNDYDKDAVYREIQTRLQINTGKKQEVPLRVRYKRLYRWTRVAAMLILFVGLGYYFFTRSAGVPQKNVEITRIKDIRAPQTNRAMITMSDGTVMDLDSAGNGQLAAQGAAQLVKLANGVIAYKLSGKGSQITAPIYNTLTNPRGSRVIHITLSDGSAVWLNAGSSITYPVVFTGNERNVTLLGEAYFEVAKDKIKKFIVRSGQIATEVLGTHFNINAYEDESDIKVTLLEGRVKVNGNGHYALLSPGMQARIGAAGELRIITDVDVLAETGWKNGYFSFNNADIAAVMRQLARWYDVTIVFEGEIPNREFEGEIQRTLSLSDMLKILEKNKVNFKIEGRKIIVIP